MREGARLDKRTWKFRTMCQQDVVSVVSSSTSLSDAARRLGLNKATIYRWVRKRLIPGLHGTWRTLTEPEVKKLAAPPRRRVCVLCEAEFFQSGRGGRNAKVCLNCRPEYKARPSTCIDCGCRIGWKRTRCVSCNREFQRIPPSICWHCKRQFVPKANNRLKFCGRECCFAYRTFHAKGPNPNAPYKRSARLKRLKRLAEHALLPCAHCRQPLGPSLLTQRVHASCAADYRRAYSRQLQRRRRGTPSEVTRSCLWCERSFTIETARGSMGRILCSKRCVRRWKRVCEKHHLTRHSSREVIQGYRLLGDAYYALQQRPKAPTKLTHQTNTNWHI